MMNESVKKSPEKSKNVLEEKLKIVKQKIRIKKTHMFTIIAMNCVQEQLKREVKSKKKVLEQNVQANNLHKDTTTIMAPNCVREQLKIVQIFNLKV